MALISIYTHFKAPTLSSSSTIIQDVACLNEARSALMACFHFDFRDLDKQHRRDLPPFLLVQLSSQSHFCCDIFPPLYSACHNGAQKPSDEVMSQGYACDHRSTAYLHHHGHARRVSNWTRIPSPREQVLSLVKELVDLHLPHLHICITADQSSISELFLHHWRITVCPCTKKAVP